MSVGSSCCACLGTKMDTIANHRLKSNLPNLNWPIIRLLLESGKYCRMFNLFAGIRELKYIMEPDYLFWSLVPPFRTSLERLSIMLENVYISVGEKHGNPFVWCLKRLQSCNSMFWGVGFSYDRWLQLWGKTYPQYLNVKHWCKSYMYGSWYWYKKQVGLNSASNQNGTDRPDKWNVSLVSPIHSSPHLERRENLGSPLIRKWHKREWTSILSLW